jgi:predicted porin
MHRLPPRTHRPASTRVPHQLLARAGRVLLAALVVGPGLTAPAAALEAGPFTLNGFVKGEVTRVSSYCKDNSCQVDPLASKEFPWADEMVQGKGYGAGTAHVTLAQPYLGAKADLPMGFKLSGLLSQRWRDGKEDFEGFWYDKSVALSHEDYGSLRVGAMTTRAWSMADYPFGTDIGLADPWASSGAGYGLLTRALRYTSRTFDVYDGDLVLEATHDIGQQGWHRNKPRFFEVWAHYGHGDLALYLMLQQAKNGTPSAFGHGPFTALFYDARFDSALGGSSQGIAMLMARYRWDARLEFLGGARANRWSGAYAKLLQSRTVNPGGFDIWNNPFNVDWSTDLGGGVFKGYAARSRDLVLGARHREGPWAVSAGLLHLGKAKTDNPSERGQSNAATLATLGLDYDLAQGLRVYGTAGLVHYARKGLAPTSMPSNSAFTGVDSRLERNGNWFGTGLTYTF